VRLSATPFHPQGGGQPSDTGRIGDVEVLRVVSESEGIIHYTAAPSYRARPWRPSMPSRASCMRACIRQAT
jgi:Ser-tRNA(Ala) deacylase AlaX